ncbi:MAG: protein-methionine-sulfoxide reductase catalytic subunit MsrP [Thiohalospira sp.]
MFIRPQRPWQGREQDVTPESVYRQRRRFMRDAAGVLLTASGLPALAGAAIPEGRFDDPEGPGRFSTDEDRTPYGDVTGYNNFFEFGSSKSDPKEYAESMPIDPWSIRVEGEAEETGDIPLEDFIRPHAFEERIYRLRCVEGWSMVIPWIGFPLTDVIRRLRPTSRAKYVEFTTLHDPDNMRGQRRDTLDWPYVEGLRMDEASHPLTILAVGLYGEALPKQNGAPIRLVVPWKYGFKSIKSIVKIRFVEEQPTSSWMRSAPDEYGFYANVNPEVSHPRWSQRRERRIGEFGKRPTEKFNGYGEWVAGLYRGMDLEKHF